MKINRVFCAFQCTKMLGKSSPQSLDIKLSATRKEEYSEIFKNLSLVLIYLQNKLEH